MVHKMKTLEEVLYDYTRGEKTLEEANKALKELGCGLTLDPTRNLFSARELLETRARPTAGAFWTTVWAAWKRSMW